MDDLYDNLQNYQDENIIDELKNENKELKTKLEEYSSAMILLQKDLDKLQSEYKKLETNYSSLLKTARAEIERKAEMIKSLNTEKDLLIIKTLQTSGNNMWQTRRFSMNKIQQSKNSHEINTKCSVKQPSELSSGNPNEEKKLRNDRIISTHSQSEDTTSNLENQLNFSEDEVLRESNNGLRNKTDKRKENITNEIQKDVPMDGREKKIINRRKSLPFCSNIERIYSSDDDFEALNLKNIRKSPLREDSKHFTKFRSRDNFSSKDRFYNNKTDKLIDHGKYIYNRYESSSKYSRHSAEKYRSKYTKENSETHKSRADYTNSRQKVPRSPPTDKYNRSKSRDRRTFERENYYDKQRRSPHNYENSAVKHKIRNELEEPSSKRHKADPNKKSSIAENISNNDREIEHSLRDSYLKHDFIEPSSCQSPDYVNVESTIPQQVVKEIKHTAVTPLEDPRISSKKYAIKGNKGKTVLSTVISEDFDIKPVNVSLWDIPNIKKFTIPPKLPTKRLSEETNSDFVIEMHNMDVDKPLLEDSLELGEIRSLKDAKDNDRDIICENKNVNRDHIKTLSSLIIDSNKMNPAIINKYKIPTRKKPDQITTGIKNENFDLLSKKPNSANSYCIENKTHETEKKCEDSAMSRPIPNTENVSIDDIDSNKMNPAIINKYKIPTRKKPDKITTGIKNENLDLLSKKPNSANSYCIENKTHETEKKCEDSAMSRPIPNTENVSIDEQCKNNDISRINMFPAVNCTLADDLELSDEASESRDIQKDSKSKKNLPKNKPSVDSLDLNKQKLDMLLVNDENINKEPEEKSKPLSLKKGTKDSSRESGKNRKNKKKSELKEVRGKEESYTAAKEQNNELQTSSKFKSKSAISIQTKHKFSDLFGDSSSLITPDDLGIPAPDIQLPLTDKYVSIFDNTQDAVDLNVQDINRAQSDANNASAFPSIRQAKSNDKTPIVKSGNDAEKLLVSKDLDKNCTPTNLLEHNLHEKATSNDDSEIVKTVIISTGVQPKYTSESNILQSKIEQKDKINIDKSNMKACVLDNIKALATSTPQKTEHVDIATAKQEPVSNDHNTISENINLSSNLGNASNPDEVLNEADVPDVRLIVRRRRKVIKKP